MITLHNLRDLEKYGIIPLTGEACNIGLRILCDVTEQGRKLICAALGLPHDTKFSDSWNSGYGGSPHVGSLLVPYEMFSPIAVVALFHKENCKCVATVGEQVIGITEEDYKEFAEREEGENRDPVVELQYMYESSFKRTYSPLNVPHQGLSNVHQMSGRAQ